jgi:hypothetical protein
MPSASPTHIEDPELPTLTFDDDSWNSSTAEPPRTGMCRSSCRRVAHGGTLVVAQGTLIGYLSLDLFMILAEGRRAEQGNALFHEPERPVRRIP